MSDSDNDSIEERRHRSDRGSVSAEYGMIAAGIAGAILIAVSQFGERVSALFTLG